MNALAAISLDSLGVHGGKQRNHKMSRRRRQREEVWQAKHYQPEADEWPLKEFDFGDDDERRYFEQNRDRRDHQREAASETA